MCPSRLRRSTQVATESTAVLFDTETAGDGAATARLSPFKGSHVVVREAPLRATMSELQRTFSNYRSTLRLGREFTSMDMIRLSLIHI